MSERGLGVAEREALERARLGEVARRVAGYRRLEEVAALGELEVAEQTGDRSTERLLQELWRLGPGDARRLVAEARDLCPRTALLGEALPPRLPATARAAAAGEIGPAHIEILRRTMARLDRVQDLAPERWDEAERTLAQRATELGPKGLQAVADRLLAHLDPDGERPPPEGSHSDDELLIVRRKDGTVLFRGRMSDPVEGEAFCEVIDDLAAPYGPEDQRELAQRRIEGLKDLVEDAHGPQGLATRVRAEGRDGDEPVEDTPIPEPRRPDPAPVERPGRALLTITMDHRWLRATVAARGGFGTLDSGVRVDAATVRRWACDAEVVPVVLGARSEPLDVGRRSRLVTDAIRRALNLRDGGCAFPGCSRRPRRCHAHHIDRWRDGGVTAVDNMALLCRFHHQLIHAGHWSMAIVEGRPWFTPPWFVDPDRQPRPGGRPLVVL